MALSQAYLEWEKQTEQRGIEQGIQQERQQTIINILNLRFSNIDDQLEGCIAAMMELPPATIIPLLIQLSRDELLQRFTADSN